jgi:hypothetical protein
MGVIKRKGTRKIRKNRQTHRRKNRSYKRMKGGVGVRNKKIVKLLTNLIINNLTEDNIKRLCRPQSQSQSQSPSQSTAEQPLLPAAEQPLLLKNANEVNQILIDTYTAIIKARHNTGNFEYTFVNSKIPKSIIDALKTKGISYFDELVKNNSTVPILSPNDFDSSLTSSSRFNGIFIKDELVCSMFALSDGCISLIPALANVTVKIDLNKPVCPPISYV